MFTLRNVARLAVAGLVWYYVALSLITLIVSA